jgi:hypothetical protein
VGGDDVNDLEAAKHKLWEEFEQQYPRYTPGRSEAYDRYVQAVIELEREAKAQWD